MRQITEDSFPEHHDQSKRLAAGVLIQTSNPLPPHTTP